jgi:hypothetical protein
MAGCGRFYSNEPPACPSPIGFDSPPMLGRRFKTAPPRHATTDGENGRRWCGERPNLRSEKHRRGDIGAARFLHYHQRERPFVRRGQRVVCTPINSVYSAGA